MDARDHFSSAADKQRRTLGYHVVLSGYGLWLPGDRRGSWSERWDDVVGYLEPHQLQPGDPVRRQMARERQSHPAVRLTPAMTDAVLSALAGCAAESAWSIHAASVESTQAHLLMSYSSRDIDSTIKWLKDRTTKAVHNATDHDGPVWSKGKWRSYVFSHKVWLATCRYIERHNQRRGVGPRPHAFLA